MAALAESCRTLSTLDRALYARLSDCMLICIAMERLASSRIVCSMLERSAGTEPAASWLVAPVAPVTPLGPPSETTPADAAKAAEELGVVDHPALAKVVTWLTAALTTPAPGTAFNNVPPSWPATLSASLRVRPKELAGACRATVGVREIRLPSTSTSWLGRAYSSDVPSANAWNQGEAGRGGRPRRGMGVPLRRRSVGTGAIFLDSNLP